MTLPNVTPRKIFIGSDNFGPFEFQDGDTAIRVTDDTHLNVVRYSTVDDETGQTLVLNTDYVVAGNPDTVSITLIGSQTALSANERLLVERSQPFNQDLDLTVGGNLSAADIEARIDKQEEHIQDLRMLNNRSLKANWADAEPPKYPPVSSRVGKYMGWNELGNVEVKEPPTVASAADILAETQIFTGNGTQTAFVFTATNASTIQHFIVTIDFLLTPQTSTYYTVSNDGTDATVTFTTAPPDGTQVVLRTNVSTGVAGPQGLQGPQGVAGTDGVDGTNGTNGSDGADGADGVDGVDGSDGADGVDGTLTLATAVTSATTAVKNTILPINATSAFPITLPAHEVGVQNSVLITNASVDHNNCGTNTVTVTDGTDNYLFNVDGAWAHFVSDGTSWHIVEKK